MTEEFKEINPVLLELLAGFSVLSGRDSCGPVFCSLSDPEYVSDH